MTQAPDNPLPPSVPGQPAAQSAAPVPSPVDGAALRPSFQRYVRRPAARPRRVTGGLRLKLKEGESFRTAAARAFLGLFTSHALIGAESEGVEYARLGQTSEILFVPGSITATVQGRMSRPYHVRIESSPFDDARWDALVALICSEARVAAAVLAGELTEEAEARLAAQDFHLVPEQWDQIRCSCTCAYFRPDDPRCCKHILAIAWLVGEKLDQQPALAFKLRGLDPADVVERVRIRRTLDSGLSRNAQGMSSADLPDMDDQLPALQDSVGDFWQAGPELAEIEALPVLPPAIPHSLLRRLGPSPFITSRFPIVGLLATCYDIVSQSILHEQVEPEAPSAALGIDPGADELDEADRSNTLNSDSSAEATGR